MNNSKFDIGFYPLKLVTLFAPALFLVFLVCEFWLPSVYVKDIPLRSYVLALSFLSYFLFIFRGDYAETLKKKPFLLTCLVFFLLTFFRFINYFLGHYNFGSYVFHSLRYIVQPFFVFFTTYLFIAAYKTRFFKLLLFFACVSSAIAFLQYLNIDLFWKLRYLLGKDPDAFVWSMLSEKSRAVGLAQYWVPLGYQIVTVFPLIFYFVVRNKKNHNWLVVFLLLLLGIFSIGTRSALLAIIIGLVYMYLVRKDMRKIILHCFAAILAIAILFMALFFCCKTSLYPRILHIDSSVMLRMPLFSFYFKKAIRKSERQLRQQPGKASEQASEHHEVVRYIQSKGVDICYSSEISPHNQVLNTFFFYGIAGPVILLFFYIYLWLICGKKLFFARVGIGSCFINSFFHNAGPFFGDYVWWHLCAIIVYFSAHGFNDERKGEIK